MRPINSCQPASIGAIFNNSRGESLEALYVRVGVDYSDLRRTDPRIASQLYAELERASGAINIEAGIVRFFGSLLETVGGLFERAGQAVNFVIIENWRPPAALERLHADLTSGQWEHSNQDILNRTSLDFGYRIITARIQK